MELIDIFSAFSVVISLSLFLGVASLVVCFFIYIPKLLNKKKLSFTLKVSSSLSLVLIIFGGISYNVAKLTVIAEIDNFIESSATIILVNGIKTNNKEKIFLGLQARLAFKQSGSRPTESLFLLLKNNDSELLLELKRDSRDLNMYWVYYPKYKSFSNLFHAQIIDLK